MSEQHYLAGDLVAAGELAPALAQEARRVAKGWASAGYEATLVELLSEFLARTAAVMGEADLIDGESFGAGVAWLGLPDGVGDHVCAALQRPRGRAELAALAVHLLDIAEAMAFEVFVPELPQLLRKSERTGDAARRVGVARHLRG